MKLIAQVKLQPSIEQTESLRRTLLAWNEAANYISDQAWMRKSFRAYDLHHATYYTIREKFGLAAQAAIRVIAVVADAYKLDKRSKRTFRKMGSATYDNRILRWFTTKSEVSIWTMDGRQTIPYVCGERQRKLLETLQGECDLVYRDGEFYLHQVCNVVEDDSFDPDGWLGVDMGVKNIATDSDGMIFSGDEVLGVRKRRRASVVACRPSRPVAPDVGWRRSLVGRPVSQPTKTTASVSKSSRKRKALSAASLLKTSMASAAGYGSVARSAMICIPGRSISCDPS